MPRRYVPTPARAHDCDHCGVTFTSKRADARTCSTRCRVAWHRNPHPGTWLVRWSPEVDYRNQRQAFLDAAPGILAGAIDDDLRELIEDGVRALQ